MTEEAGLALKDVCAFVSGANRGLGRAFVDELLARGARKVYAAARNPKSIVIHDDRIAPIKVDITDEVDVAAAGAACHDTALVINNAGVSLRSRFISADPRAARTEMETNYFGTLSVSRQFAPILAANGGGALVNMLSVVSFFANPSSASYCASKAAQWSLTNALRIELRQQGTHVVGVHAGFIDTEMTRTVDADKLAPRDVACQALDAVEAGLPEVLADEFTRFVKRSIPDDQFAIYPDVQRRWDTADSP